MALGMPHARLLKDGDGIWELRPLGDTAGSWRPLYAKVGKEIRLLAFAPDFEKSPAGFRKALRLAQVRRTELLADCPMD